MLKKSIISLFITVLICMVMLVGCGGGGGPTFPGYDQVGYDQLDGFEQTDIYVKPSGGSFKIPDGQMTFPPNAVNEARWLSVAKASDDENFYILQPEGINFPIPVTVDLNINGIKPGDDNEVIVSLWNIVKQEDIDENGFYDSEYIQNVEVKDGSIRFNISHFSNLDAWIYSKNSNRIVYTVPPKYLPVGSIPVALGFNPGHVGIVSPSGWIIDSFPLDFWHDDGSLGGLGVSKSIYDFVFSSPSITRGVDSALYWGAYFHPKDPTVNYAHEAGRWAQEQWINGGYSYFWGDRRNAAACTTFVQHCYDASGLPDYDLPYLPRYYISDDYPQVNEISVDWRSSAFTIQVQYNYYYKELGLGLFGSLPVDWNKSESSFPPGFATIEGIYSDHTTLRIDPSDGVLGATYKLIFTGSDIDGKNEKIDTLTIHMVGPNGFSDGRIESVNDSGVTGIINVTPNTNVTYGTELEIEITFPTGGSLVNSIDCYSFCAAANDWHTPIFESAVNMEKQSSKVYFDDNLIWLGDDPRVLRFYIFNASGQIIGVGDIDKNGGGPVVDHLHDGITSRHGQGVLEISGVQEFTSGIGIQ